MNRFGRILMLVIVVAMPVGAFAQTAMPLDSAQLDQITASVAMYPDAVLGEMLVAASHPDQVDLAAGWLDDPLNAGLQGDALRDALQNQPWDNNVKALVSTPRLLFMLSDNDEWMRELGNAFATQQGDVMDSVQRLRWQAYRGGTLQSNVEQSVALQNGSYILIQPAVGAPVQVVTVFYPVPVWDWQHHRIDGREGVHHVEAVQSQIQTQHVMPEQPEPVIHNEQEREQGRPVMSVGPQVAPQEPIHAQPPVEPMRGVEERLHEQTAPETAPTPLVGRQP